MTAQRLSHHYTGRIANIPLPPPSPVPDILIDPSIDPRRGFSPSENGTMKSKVVSEKNAVAASMPKMLLLS